MQKIVSDQDAVRKETKNYKPIPQIMDFTNEMGKDRMQQRIEKNYYQIKADVTLIVDKEIERIKNDPELNHLIPSDEEQFTMFSSEENEKDD